MFRELEIDVTHVRKLIDDVLNNLEDYKYLYKIADAISKELRIRIDKSLDYINNFEYYIPEDNKQELIKILKGE